MRRRRDVFDEMRRMVEEAMAEPFFRSGRFLPAVREGFPVVFEPYTDMTETDKEVIFTAELPGVKKEDIKINVTENRIEVSLETEEEKEEEGEEKGGYYYESRYQGFRSSYSTPTTINPEEVKASYKNGVLEVRAEKAGIKEMKKIEVD
ncbi:MAG: Hsp20/alpha crystallin family protein [Candidatus Altiarchaeota archaeon]|nr:Hsp20/alpha crystallin family protein [Candidatus Altiarchaeota archaeon]